MTTITLCRSCLTDQSGLEDAIRNALTTLEFTISFATVDCMSGCVRPTTLACRATGKTAYLFGDISADDLPDILTFLQLYAASPDGNFADARPLGGLRQKALARIPG